MLSLRYAVAALLACALPSVNSAPTSSGPHLQPQYVPDKYLVQLKSTADTGKLDAHLAWVKKVYTSNLAKRHLNVTEFAGVEKKYEFGSFRSYAGSFDAVTIETIKASKDVLLVAQDQLFYPLEASRLDSRSLTAQSVARRSLRAISQRPYTKDKNYWYDDSAGQGTWAYVVDSGVKTLHEEFEGRAIHGWTAYGENRDRIGHGTHCAGIIGSKTYGVAKKAMIVSVKVFDQGSAEGQIILDGFNWAVNDIQVNNRVGKSVISMSLGGGRDQIINNAVKAAFDAGITVVVGAGNDNQDAYNTSPASAPEAITVGALDTIPNEPTSYNKASYSNFGSVVDVFAPGTDILSTYIGDGNPTRELSGTSMACPHVSGLALYFQALYGKQTPQQFADRLISLSSKGSISGLPSGTLNRLAYNGSGK